MRTAMVAARPRLGITLRFGGGHNKLETVDGAAFDMSCMPEADVSKLRKITVALYAAHLAKDRVRP